MSDHPKRGELSPEGHEGSAEQLWVPTLRPLHRLSLGSWC